MRLSLALLPCLFLGVACSAPTAEEQTGSSEARISAYGSCSLTRANILSSVSAERRGALERGFSWLDESVPYSQSRQHEGYRTDCSGFVSMVWEAPKPGANTASLTSNGLSSRLSSFEDMVPADAFLKSGHTMIFLGWNDDAHTSACVLEQSSTKNDMQFRARSVASLKSQGYKGVRASKFAGDTEFGPGTSAAEEERTLLPEEMSGTDEGPMPTEPTCPTATQTCEAAFELAAVDCGVITDSCGRRVDCNQVAGFGCGTGQICNTTNHCVTVADPVEETPVADASESETAPPVSTAFEGELPETVAKQGDPGDEDDDRERSDEPDPSAPAASGGCSAAAPAGATAEGVFPLLALVFGLGLARRRRS